MESWCSSSTASREMLFLRWRRKNQIKRKIEQPKAKRAIFIEVGQVVAKRMKALVMPRAIV